MEETSKRPRPLQTAFLLLLSALAGGVAGAALFWALDDDDSAAPTPVAVSRPRLEPAGDGSGVVEVVRTASPSVVTIVNQMTPRRTEFGDLVEETAVGSGVIIDPSGYVVTNGHVVRDAETLTVKLASGEELPATLVSSDDPFTDLAVIKIKARSLPALTWGDSDALELGEPVIAIGSALNDFEGSVTVGVVSGLHRRWLREGIMMEDLVQTDAAVNHGNSGGALLNRRGELIGLNSTVIRSTEEGDIVEGIAFAISSKAAAPIVEAIVRDGSFPRPYLGVVHQDIDEQMTAYDLPADHGAVVLHVSPDTPAAAAGLQEGDIILSMGGVDLGREMPFLNALGSLPVDQALEFIVNRDGEELTLEVRLTLRER